MIASGYLQLLPLKLNTKHISQGTGLACDCVFIFIFYIMKIIGQFVSYKFVFIYKMLYKEM